MGVVFDIDVCAPKGGLPWIPAKKVYSLDDDGLSQNWQGFIWCNPPYGKETAKWLAKCAEHGNGIALVFSRTDCKWFHESVDRADGVFFMKGRIQFVDGNGLTGNSGTAAGSMLVGYGEKAINTLLWMELLGKGRLYRKHCDSGV